MLATCQGIVTAVNRHIVALLELPFPSSLLPSQYYPAAPSALPAAVQHKYLT